MEDITEGKHQVYFNARFMSDRHTHYEANTYIKGLVPCTITIPGHVESEFRRMYGDSMRSYIIHAELDFIENQHHVAPDVYKGTTHLRGTLHSLEDIT
ncbi:hypothetical protein HZA98_00320, partial [Candidatus Woesearchaeota archaeon]|nr:hypothetical protein [Candidatus Woesearchaeota archaeon]